MNLADLFPRKGKVQRLYCDLCENHLDLAFTDWENEVSDVHIRVEGLPVLRCPACNREHLPDGSRFAVLRLHEQAMERGAPAVSVKRKKRTDTFTNFTDVPFRYDADDYFYIPGLERPYDVGFLTPIFFNREVLLKYDSSPRYRVLFASTTYGTIYSDEDVISFGVNRHGKVFMWLGDIAKMPDAEQYYLRSENVPSDHSIGGEFYDGQIECKFTPITAENALFQARSEFIEACYLRLKTKIAQLDAEVVTLSLQFNAPIVDTEKERRHVADTLNKIYLESLDSGALGTILKGLGGDPKELGSLKRLQSVLTAVTTGLDVAALLSPFFVLYDLRVAYSHLTSAGKSGAIMETVTDRLGLRRNADLFAIYGRIVPAMTESFERLTGALK